MSYEDYSLPTSIPEPPEDDQEPVTPTPNVKRFNDGLPSSIQTEVTVLGAMLLDSTAISAAMARLEVEDFLLDSHQRIYRAILLAQEDLPSNSPGQHLTLETMEVLSRRKELDAIGGPAYLAFLTEGIPRNPNIESYVRIIKDKSTLRQLLSAFNEGMARASEQSDNAIDIATDVIANISQAIERGQTRTEVFDSPPMAMDAAKRLLESPERVAVIPTGIKALDDFTGGGIRLGELWIIGASPSRGKTTLARQIVMHAIRQGFASYVHSGEMTKESWYDITACLLVGMQTWKIREPWLLNSFEKDMLRAGIKELSSLPLHISDAGGIHIDKLLWNASRAVREQNAKLKVVDYAQIIRANGRDERERVSAVAQKERVWAKENNVASILLSQSPRPEGRNINSRPNMFALKESGTLEEAAHTILLPFRRVDPETNAFTGEDEFVIAKQRWGPIGSIPVRLDGRYLKFVERQTDGQTQ